MRGLKRYLACGEYGSKVASFTDAWIETPTRSIVPKRAVPSHLLQMRGLKLKVVLCPSQVWVSHLLQMRGLKLRWHRDREIQVPVASFTDAWIETSIFI